MTNRQQATNGTDHYASHLQERLQLRSPFLVALEKLVSRRRSVPLSLICGAFPARGGDEADDIDEFSARDGIDGEMLLEAKSVRTAIGVKNAPTFHFPVIWLPESTREILEYSST